MHSMVLLQNSVSDGTHSLSSFVCRSWPNVVEILLKELYPSRVTIFRFFQQLSECVLWKPLSSANTRFFSGMRRRLSSLARVTAISPCGTWACSLVTLKTSWHRSFLMIFMKRSFLASRIILLSRYMWENPQGSWGQRDHQQVLDWRLRIFSRWLSLTWRNHGRQKILVLV